MDPLTLPAFLVSVFCLYWSLPLSCLTGYTHWWKVWGTRRSDVVCWTKFLVEAMGARIHVLGDQQLYRGGKCLYLANHRSWADFFVDAYLAEGRAQMMSRLAVLYVFPFFMIPVCLIRGCLVFKRGSIHDKEAFNAWIDASMDASSQDGLLVYPEGHRSAGSESLPLKRGMLHFAYSRRLPVQVIMSAGKEDVMNEKTLAAGYGKRMVTQFGTVIHSKDYADFEAFFQALSQEWRRLWDSVFAATPAGLPRLVQQPPLQVAYPPALRASQVVWPVVSAAAMVLVVGFSVRLLWALGGLAGPTGPPVLFALLAVWFAASFAQSFARPQAWDGGKTKSTANGEIDSRARA